jgi:nucleolar protein 9
MSHRQKKSSKNEDIPMDGEGEPPMEKCFLDTMSEIESNIGFLMTDRFASHVLRNLLVVFSGESLDSSANKQLMQSKNKESIKVEGKEKSETKDQNRKVPESFSVALEKLLSDSIAGLDTEKLRALATSPNGNPTLQLLLRIELSHFGKQRAKDESSVIRTLLPDEPITSECSSAAFINAMIYDNIGSRLIETLVESAPAKLFKNIYGTLFKERLPSYARNEIASFVACRIMERLGKDELLAAHESIAPTIPSLLERNRTNIVRTLIERCTVRGIDTRAIAVHINSTWDGPDGFEIKKLLKIDDTPDSKPKKSDHAASNANATGAAFVAKASEPVKAHFNVLAQAMLLVPGALSGLVLDALIGLDSETLFSMSKDAIVSRTLQAALTTHNASTITIRKLVQRFYGHIGEMSLDKAASHVVDCIWEGTHGLAFIRERIAEELAENEHQLRESPCGRAVWKNWKMDMYKRRRGDWVRQSKNKASNDGFQSFSELEDVKKNGAVGSTEATAQKKKSPLELARERHAKKKAEKESGKIPSSRPKSSGRPTGGAGAGTGSNSTPVAAMNGA